MLENPFKPTAGKTPPEIIGREAIIEEFVEGLDNGAGAPGRLMRISGSRGTGKTVLLHEMAKIARSRGWHAIEEIAVNGFCARLLDALTPDGRLTSSSVAPSVLGVSLGSLTIERTAPTLRSAMEKAADKNAGLLITLDEVQDASIDEVRLLATVFQQLIGEDKNVAFVFAGLPSMIEDVINGKTLTFLRRAVPFDLKPVGNVEVRVSLTETMRDSGMQIDGETAEQLAVAAAGYPFMIQLVGYHAWQRAKRATSTNITPELAQAGIAMARERFESSVIEPALQRISDLEIAFLLSMAMDGDGASATGAVAGRLGRTSQQLSVQRAHLIRDAIIEAAGWGKVRFAIPYLAEYLAHHFEEMSAMLGVDLQERLESAVSRDR